MGIKGNLQKKVYKDRRTGVKRRWMEYWKVRQWLNVRDKTTDWGPVIVAFFSIILACSIKKSKTFFCVTKRFRPS